MNQWARHQLEVATFFLPTGSLQQAPIFLSLAKLPEYSFSCLSERVKVRRFLVIYFLNNQLRLLAMIEAWGLWYSKVDYTVVAWPAKNIQLM